MEQILTRLKTNLILAQTCFSIYVTSDWTRIRISLAEENYTFVKKIKLLVQKTTKVLGTETRIIFKVLVEKENAENYKKLTREYSKGSSISKSWNVFTSQIVQFKNQRAPEFTMKTSKSKSASSKKVKIFDEFYPHEKIARLK